MASNKLAKKLIISGWVAVFLLFFLVFLIKYSPLSLVNLFLKNQNVEILQPKGNLNSASFAGVIINQKYYPLSCDYHRKFWLTYKLSCNSPLQIDATIEFGILKQLNIKAYEVNVYGDISKASAWMELANIPSGISGYIDLVVKSLDINNSQIDYLDISGVFKDIEFFNYPLIENIDIKTTNYTNPVTIDIYANGKVEMFLESTIKGKEYITKGIIRGDTLQNYATILNYFGRRNTIDEWAISLSGNLLP